MVVSVRRHEDAVDDLELLFDALAGQVDAGVELRAGLPFPVIVDMQKAGFLEPVEVPESRVGDVRPQLVQVPEVVRPDSPQHGRRKFAIRGPRQEADFGIEVLANLGVGDIRRPLFRAVLRTRGEGAVPAVESGRLGSRGPSLQHQVIADTPAAVDSKSSVVVILPRSVEAAVAVAADIDCADGGAIG